MKCQTVRHRTWDKGLGMQFRCLSTLCGGDLAPHCVCVSSNHRKMMENGKRTFCETILPIKRNLEAALHGIQMNSEYLWIQWLTLRVAFEENAQVYTSVPSSKTKHLCFRLSKSQYHDGATRPHVPRQLHGAIHVPLEWARPWLRPNLDCCEGWACWTLLQFVAVSKSTSTWQPY